MKTNKEILSSVLKTTQMGQVGIRSVQKIARKPELKQALSKQLEQYDDIETQASLLASERGWKLREVGHGAKKMAEMYTRSKLMGKNCDSKIAAMMIHGNTRGVIKGLKNAHRHAQPDSRVTALSQKLLDCEHAGIQDMKPYL